MAKYFLILVALVMGNCRGNRIYTLTASEFLNSRTQDTEIYVLDSNFTTNGDSDEIYTIENATSTTGETADMRSTGKETHLEEITMDDVDYFRGKLRRFAANFYNQLRRVTEENQNIVYSPISISHALGMVNTGARGNSSTQIKKSFQLEADTKDSYIDAIFKNITFKKFNGSLDLEIMKIMVARSYIQSSLVVQPDFIDNIQDKYHSDVVSVDFDDSKNVTKRINQWVEEETQELIKDLIAPGIITPFTQVVLVNALYFKAPWATKFDEDTPRDFATPSGKVTVPFMDAVIECHHDENDHYAQIAVPYKDDKTFFVIILPHTAEHMKLFESEEIIEEFFEGLPHRISTGWGRRYIKLFLPKFSVDQSIKADKILKTMGVNDIFTESLANLTGISEGLFVSDFVHKAKLSVDERGTEAAAASAAVMARRSLVDEVFVNRPFIFGIVETEGNILFMGKIVNPSGK